MYYYVFDPPKGPKEYDRTAQIKSYVSSLGIAGEIVQPQPGKTVEDLVATAITKRYSTVIAVGGIDLINRMARVLAPHDVVFGIIPLVDHPDVEALIGTTDWKLAADQLQRRRFGLCRMGILGDGTVFLTPAHLDLGLTHRFELNSKKMAASGQGGILTITPSQDEGETALRVEIEERAVEKRWWERFGKGQEPQRYTKFNLREFSLSSDPVLELAVAGTAVTQTPFSCKVEKKALKLIAGHQGEEQTRR
jgi:hypothetical protein